jgi:putative MFS transporter
LILLTTSGLASLSLVDSNMELVHDHLLMLLSALMVGANGIIAVLLPYAAENYPVRVRGRGTGLVAGASKLGGLLAQALAVSSLVPAFGVAAFVLALPMAISAGMVARCCPETCQRRLDSVRDHRIHCDDRSSA